MHYSSDNLDRTLHWNLFLLVLSLVEHPCTRPQICVFDFLQHRVVPCEVCLPLCDSGCCWILSYMTFLLTYALRKVWTPASNKQYATAAVQGHDIDYVHRLCEEVSQYVANNILQYFKDTDNIWSLPVLWRLFQFFPNHQHSMRQILKCSSYSPIYNQHFLTHTQEQILCVRVDGACVKVQVMRKCSTGGHLATLVMARSSGSSHLNWIELQNGCMTRGHSNLFIPSILAGCCMKSGQVNKEILKQNLELVI